MSTAAQALEPVTLGLALYRVIPDCGSFEETVEACRKERPPEVALRIVDRDCCGSEVPEDLDVFVPDTTNPDVFSEKSCLLPLSEEDLSTRCNVWILRFFWPCRISGTAPGHFWRISCRK